MDDKKFLEKPEKSRRTEGFRVSLDGEWKKYSARVLDAGECIYEAYATWDMRVVYDEDDIMSLSGELDNIHTGIRRELDKAVWSSDFAERYLSIEEYVMLTEVNDMIYAVLKSSFYGQPYSDKIEEVQYGEDQ